MIEWADAIDICLPTDAHKTTALQVIAGGKHVMCEKPMGLDVAECAEMLEAAAKANVTLMPAQVVRYFPDFRHAHNLVEGGAVGKPLTARTRRGGKAPAGSDGWFQDPDRSGGVLLDLAVHDFDWLRWTLGEVRRVTSRSVRLGRPEALVGKPGDYALTTLEFDSGAIAHVEATWLDPSGFRTTLEVCGDDGMIEFDSRNIGVIRRHNEENTQVENPVALGDDPYYRQGRAFVDTITGKIDAPVTALDGLMAVSIARAAMESAKTLMPVAPARHH
jgi:predicted dehydrogenase